MAGRRKPAVAVAALVESVTNSTPVWALAVAATTSDRTKVKITSKGVEDAILNGAVVMARAYLLRATQFERKDPRSAG